MTECGVSVNLESAISVLADSTPDPAAGLPDELFCYISRITPLVNVDLLIKDDQNRTLLSWRDDQYAGKGWHIPGGIVRFRETLESRIEKVALSEVGSLIQYEPTPIAVHQMIHTKRDIRGHFLSFLYKCFLPDSFQPSNGMLSPQSRGYLSWHLKCPSDLLPIHEVYRSFIDQTEGKPLHAVMEDVLVSNVLARERGE